MISVIIPFKNAKAYLPKLLPAIAAQKLSRAAFEVIFIDNLSDDGSVEQIAHAAPDFTYRIAHYHVRSSSYGARNVGVKLAIGDVLAFTDIDCVPEPQWLAEIDRFYAVPANDDAVLSGDVTFFFTDSLSPWEHFDRNVHMQNAARAASHEIATANMAVSLASFQRIGDFEEVLSGADYAWSERAAKESFRIVFLPEARVLHPTRGSFLEIRRKLDRIAYGQGQLCRQRQSHLGLELLRYLVRVVLPKNSLKPAFAVFPEVGLKSSGALFYGLIRIRFSQLHSFWRGYFGQ